MKTNGSSAMKSVTNGPVQPVLPGNKEVSVLVGCCGG